MTINYDMNHNRKVIIAFALYFNGLALLIHIVFKEIAYVMLWANVCVLGIQYIMDKTQHKVEPLIESHKYASKINEMMKKDG